MESRHILGSVLVSLAVLAGCSQKRETPSDVPVLPPPKQPSAPTPPPEQPFAELRTKPVTTAQDEVGELLTKWWAEGVAAGNVGDFYDNRDRAHSDLKTDVHPQLQRIKYTAAEVKGYEDWALFLDTRPHVVFGNSSTAAPTRLGGSNPREAQCIPGGVAALAEQYKANNIYIYPECNDCQPGHNGRDGFFGDLLPTNTPYLIVPQGTSYSDQTFMRAVAFTLAAFRPEVKRKLVETGTLAPTIQMILRSTSKKLTTPRDYLTAKAHPSAFQGSALDPLGMVKLAHEMTLQTLPPVVRMNVVEEDMAENGRDFFEPAGVGERLATTPEVIARIWRSSSGRRRMVVSAAASYDLNRVPLTFTWAVLRGDASQVKIVPRNETGSEVEITLPYHPRRPVAPGATLESNRVDIGVFVHNGTYHSAPGFVTFYTLDNEHRSFNGKGQQLEISYGVGEVDLRVSDCALLVQALRPADALASKAFQLTREQRVDFDKLIEEILRLRDDVARLRKEEAALDGKYEKDASELRKAKQELANAKTADTGDSAAETKASLAAAAMKVATAEKMCKESEAAMEVAFERVQGVKAEITRLTTTTRPDLGESVTQFVEKKLRGFLQDAKLFETHQLALQAAMKVATEPRRSAIDLARKSLLRTGLASESEGGGIQWHLTRGAGDSGSPPPLIERQVIERFNSALLSELVFPGALDRSSEPNFVDHHLFTEKTWRDVYHYDNGDRLTGWTRYAGRRVTEFTEAGLMVLEADNAKRPLKVQTVRYVEKPAASVGQPGTLDVVAGDEVITYSYDSGARVVTSRIQMKAKR